MTKKKTLHFEIAPDQGFAAMATSLKAPAGYVFESMERTGTKATITYILLKPKNPKATR